MSNITLNIVEPGSGPTPDPVVPNTGLFTHGIGGPEATIIAVSTILVLALVVAIVWYCKKYTNIHLSNITKHIKSKKSIAIGLTALAILVSAGTFAALLVNAGKSNTNAAEGEDEAIAPVVSGDELTIELGNEPVFAVAKTEVTVEKATDAGYTLTAFADSTDLVSTTDSSKVIPMVAVEGDELTSLIDNTYGLALAEPTSQDEEVYTALSTDADNPTLLAEKEEGTEANDTTTIYYGFYITPDTPYGTYTSGDVYYTVDEKLGPITVTFDGNNKFYFGDDASQATNAVTYVSGKQGVPQYSHTPNINDAGVQNGSYPLGEAETSIITVPGFQKIHITLSYGDGIGYYSDDWVSLWPGSNPTYTAADNYNTGLNMGSVDNGKYIFNSSYSPTPITTVNGDIDGEKSDYAVTFAYKTTTESGGTGEHTGYGYYAVVTGYDPNVAISGEYEVPTANGTYRFLGWDTNPEATTPAYTSEADIERLDLSSGAPVKLYAISEPGYVIYYNGNGADSATNMDNTEQYTTNLESTSQVDLLASNYTREGYGFAGWSTDANAWDHLTNNDESDNPTIYGPNQTITVNPATSTKLNLYAVWVPVARNNGEPVELQNWQGCSSLTPTTYNDGVLTVGKNTITALKDSRDGNVYTVARLADGNCWMVENLRLDNAPELSANNTHNPDLPLTNNYEEEATSNKLSPSSNNWCASWSTTEEQIACYNHSNLNTDNVANAASSPAFAQDFTSSAHSSNFNANILSYGNYYNWYSATAGNGTYEKSYGNADGDICPKGWRLPTGGSSGEFKALNGVMGNDTSSLGSSNWRSFPNNFVYSGGWSGPSAYGRGGDGDYWTSTTGRNDNAYVLYLYSSGVAPVNGGNKYRGFSVRCVAPGQ